MKRAKSSKSALKPNPEQSLFKFRLYFHESTDEYRAKNGQPWVWYSYDLEEEREMFPPGLTPDLRYIHTELLKRAYKWPDLFNFFKECYPAHQLRVNADPKLIYYIPKHLFPQTNDISTRYGTTVHALLKQLGVDEQDWTTVFATKGNIIPGFSPIKLPNTEFYGPDYFQRNPQVSYWLTARKLKMVKVYDNRCYHANNEIGYIGQDEFPEPSGVLSPPIRLQRAGHSNPINGRIGQETTIGAVLSNLVTP
jgi:hypothetical protein